MIEYTCPHCNNTLQIDDMFAGKVGKCNRCGKNITIPGSTPGSEITTSPQVFDTPDLGLDENVFADAPPAPVVFVKDSPKFTTAQIGLLSCAGCITLPVIGFFGLILLGVIAGSSPDFQDAVEGMQESSEGLTGPRGNAVRSAKQYLRTSGFSCKGLIKQLSSEYGSGYTESQANYGARQAGAC